MTGLMNCKDVGESGQTEFKAS